VIKMFLPIQLSPLLLSIAVGVTVYCNWVLQVLCRVMVFYCEQFGSYWVSDGF
jgi:hypothetical protein